MWFSALALPPSRPASKNRSGACCKTAMLKPLPDSLNNPTNEKVLAFLSGQSAHSDIGDALVKATKPLGDVQIYCPDAAQYKYLIVATTGIIFGFAVGMKAIGFRLSPIFKERALKTGADERTELGPEWVSFEVFRNDWP